MRNLESLGQGQKWWTSWNQKAMLMQRIMQENASPLSSLPKAKVFYIFTYSIASMLTKFSLLLLWLWLFKLQKFNLSAEIDVQGTCKYGTRVDYILASPNSPYKYVPGSYSVISSKGTSDHHIVKVDIMKVNASAQKNAIRQCRKLKRKVVKITPPCSATGVRESTPPPKIFVP